MPQIIWIARHANRLDFVNPDWFLTAERRYDPPLSDDGIVQAQQLANRLKETNITHTIFGNLTIKDITKNISFKANVQGLQENNPTVTADFNLNRQDWEIGHSNEQSILDELKDNALRPEFNVKLDIQT